MSGLGDAKLLMLAGAWFGWPGTLFVLGAGAVQGTLVVIPILLFKGKIEEPEAVKQEREEIRKELEAMSPEDRAEAEKELELEADPLAEEAGEGLGQIPPGTHEFEKFIGPDRMNALLADAGLKCLDFEGIAWSPTRGLHLSDDMRLNYLVAAVRA